MIYGDNQTKHFYALKGTDKVEVNSMADDPNLIRLVIKNDGGKTLATTDHFKKDLIKKIKVNEVKPTYFRKWTINALTSVVPSNVYHIYFYLENTMGFGIQNRWDLVVSHTATSSDTVTTVMTALQKDLDNKLNAAGPVKGDFKVTLSGDNIVVAEDPNSETFKAMTELDLRMHTNPYAYHVTMSTGVEHDGVVEAWSAGQKEIFATNTTDVYISAASKVQAMEIYFLRNRGDKYDLTNNFYVSILNQTNTDMAAQTYYTVDVDYAFSDFLGWTYHSDKQMSFAIPTKEAAEAIMGKIKK